MYSTALKRTVISLKKKRTIHLDGRMVEFLHEIWCR